MDEEKTVRMAAFSEFGWNGCWKCEHCLAVCPSGAISIFGHKPEDSLIPHAPLGRGEPVQDVLIAGTYFELLCASRGLGAVMLTFPLGALARMPEIKAMLQIPEDHYTGMMIGFGYPEIRYARGVQKTTEERRIHRPEF